MEANCALFVISCGVCSVTLAAFTSQAKVTSDVLAGSGWLQQASKQKASEAGQEGQKEPLRRTKEAHRAQQREHQVSRESGKRRRITERRRAGDSIG